MLKARAKELYFSYHSHNEISQQLAIQSSQLSEWRKVGGWDIEREHLERGLIEDSFGARRLSIARICKLSIDQLERSLKHISDRSQPASLAEAEKISIIVSNLDKILRLDMGKSTENVAVSAQVTHTVEDIRAKLAQDPVLGAAIAAASKPKVVPPAAIIPTRVHEDE